jgi:hypothetical protein
MAEAMKNTPAILFVLVLIVAIVWFVSIGRGRASTAGSDGTGATIYVIITVAMGFLNDTLLSNGMPVQALVRTARWLRKRLKRQKTIVKEAKANIIRVEEQGFGYDQGAAQLRAAHTIAKDHAKAKPCSK